MDEKTEGTFEVLADALTRQVLLKLPLQNEAYALDPEDAAAIGLSLANNAIVLSEHTGIPIGIDVVQPLFDRLAVGLRTESNEKPSDIKDLATVVSIEGNVHIQLGESEVFVVSPENARRLADSLSETAAHAEGGKWVGTSRAEGGWSGTSGGDA